VSSHVVASAVATGPSGRSQGRRSVFWAAAMVSLWTVGVGVMSSLKAWEFHDAGFDLGVVVQGLRTVAAHGPFAEVPMLGQSFLDDHFSPLVLLLTPLARLPQFPYILLVVQTAALGVAGFLVWRIASRHHRPHPLLHLVAFLVAPVVVGAVWSDFHMSTVAAPFIVLTIDALIRRDDRQALWAGSLAAISREDVALFVLILVVVLGLRRQSTLLALIASACVLGGALLGSANWFVATGTQYLGTGGNLLLKVARTAWDSGQLIVLILALLLPWVFLGRIGWRFWLVSALWFAPLMLLDVRVLDNAGSHYFLPIGAALAVGAASSTRSVVKLEVLPVAAVTLSFLVGPLGVPIAGYQGASAWNVIREARSDGPEFAAMHRWVSSLSLGESVAAANPLVPWIERSGVWVWPSPLDDVVFAEQGTLPIVRADPDSAPTDVVAPRSALQGLGPTGDQAGLPASGFTATSISPDGSYVWWQKVAP
jgi:uncharacterized membrane protein